MRLAKARFDAGVDALGAGEFGQEHLAWTLQPAAEGAVVTPDVLGVDEQAVVGRGAQQELQPPEIFSGFLVLVPGCLLYTSRCV